MFAIDAWFLRIAALYAVAGMSLGIWMAVSGDHGQFPTHAHVNLIGWVSFAIYGLVYRAYPAAAQSPLAPWHFGLANLGALILVVGVGGILAGYQQFEPVAGVGSVVTLLGAALFAAILFCRPRLTQPEPQKRTVSSMRFPQPTD
jgi:hypothetical protein